MPAPPRRRNTALDAAIARHAAANGLPVELVHRVVIRESRYNPRASNRGNLGLMQIKHATARGVGYTGPASGLFDAETNLTYAVAISRAPTGRPAATRAARSRFMPAATTAVAWWRGAPRVTWWRMHHRRAFRRHRWRCATRS